MSSMTVSFALPEALCALIEEGLNSGPARELTPADRVTLRKSALNRKR